MKSVSRRLVGSSEARERITDIYIITMLLIFPLFTGFSGYSNITFSKYVAFVSVTGVWLAALLLSCFWGAYRPPRPCAAQIFALVFMALCCISTLLSQYRAEAIIGASRYDGLVTQLLYGFVFLGVSYFSRAKRVFFDAFAVSCSLCCVVALLQLFGLNPLWLFPGSYDYYDSGIHYTSRFLGTIGNVDVLVSLLCLALPTFISLFVTDRHRLPALYIIPITLSSLVFFAADVSGGLVALGVCVLFGAPIFLTDIRLVRRSLLALVPVLLSAAAALAFSAARADGVLTFSFSFGTVSFVCAALAALCAVVSLIFHFSRGFEPSKKQLRTFLSVISLVCLVSFFSAAYLWKGTDGTLYELSQILHGNFDDSFGSHRILIWREVLALVPQSPIFGGGPDTLALRLNIEFSRLVTETGDTLRVFVDNAHNEYLGYLVNIGIPGLASYICVLLCSFAALVKRRNSGVERCLILPIVCACTQSFFGIGLCLTVPLLWMYLGLAVGRTADRPGG